MHDGIAMKADFVELPVCGMSSSRAQNIQRRINAFFLSAYMEEGPAAELARCATAFSAGQEKKKRRRRSQPKSHPPRADKR
jgi:hypothetical protein